MYSDLRSEIEMGFLGILRGAATGDSRRRKSDQPKNIRFFTLFNPKNDLFCEQIIQ